MQPDIQNTCQEADTTNWKEIPVDYGRYRLTVRVPPDCAIIGMIVAFIREGFNAFPYLKTGKAAAC